MTPAERRQMMLAGPIVPTILALAAPNVLNVAMQSLVSISDAWFVGRLGTLDLAALALVFPTQMTLGQMSAGAMGGGVSSAIARAFGASDPERAHTLAMHAILIGACMGLLLHQGRQIGVIPDRQIRQGFVAEIPAQIGRNLWQ